MKANLSVDIKKLVTDMRGPKGAAALTEEFNRISKELNKLKEEVRPQAQAQLKKAETRYHDLVKKLQAAQKDLDKEVNKRISIVKKQAKEVEKNLTQYKKLAMEQKAKFQSALGGTQTKKKTSKKAASKPASTGGATKKKQRTSKKKTSSK